MNIFGIVPVTKIYIIRCSDEAAVCNCIPANNDILNTLIV